ncbi:MAG: ribonuclease Z [Saprospiraceae bacterium]|nr:ribonuclease Z [Saprospiraceae bacterium]
MQSGTFEVLVLGSNGALPAYERFPSGQLLNVNERLYLIDCGEGTQFQLRKYGVRISRIRQIFITHLHGDHVYGLPGLITTFQLMRRTEKLEIFGPPGIQTFCDQVLGWTTSQLQFELICRELRELNGVQCFDDEAVRVSALPLEHKVPCAGYLFSEKRERRKLDTERLRADGIPEICWRSLERGEDVLLPDGRRLAHAKYSTSPLPGRSFAYCSDTIYTRALLPYLKGVDLLYHETTFLHELEATAKEYGHSTTVQAAELAREAGVRAMLIGHYSARYEDPEMLAQECRSVYEPVITGKEGLKVIVPWPREAGAPHPAV